MYDYVKTLENHWKSMEIPKTQVRRSETSPLTARQLLCCRDARERGCGRVDRLAAEATALLHEAEPDGLGELQQMASERPRRPRKRGKQALKCPRMHGNGCESTLRVALGAVRLDRGAPRPLEKPSGVLVADRPARAEDVSTTVLLLALQWL